MADVEVKLTPIYASDPGYGQALVNPLRSQVVDCLPSLDGAPVGHDPRNTAGQVIKIASDPDADGMGGGETFQMTIDGINDPIIKQVNEEFKARIGLVPGETSDASASTLQQRIDLTHNYYKRIAEVKAQQGRTKPPEQPAMNPPPSAPRSTVPLLADNPALSGAGTASSVFPADSMLGRSTPAQDFVPQPQPQVIAPLTRTKVEFILAGGGVLAVEYDHVSIQGNSVILASDVESRGGLFKPSLTTLDRVVPVELRIPQMESPPLITYCIHEPYQLGGYWHLVLLLDNAS